MSSVHELAAFENAPPTAQAAPSLWQFLGPRFWRYWLVWLWMRLVALMPLHSAIALHKAGARLLLRYKTRRAFNIRRNLEVCFPELSAAEVNTLARHQFESIGALVAETAFAWCAADSKLRNSFRVVGLEHLRTALDRGRGVILFTGHLTSLEICARAIASFTPWFACMATPRRNALMDEIQRRGRQRIVDESFPDSDVRAMLRSLRRNAVVWYAPDEVYLGSNGRLIEFFGVPAMTNVSTSKLARISGAAVIPYFCRRLPGDTAYELRFQPELENFPSDDPADDTQRLMIQLENFIRLCPEQYLWTHRRFKGRPAGYPDVYSERP